MDRIFQMGTAVAQYRMLLLDERGSIEAVDRFEAEDDETAEVVSTTIWDACSDHHGGYVLWGLSHRLTSFPKRTDAAATAAALHELTPEVQQLVLEHEEILQQSRLRVAHSKRLIEATDMLRRLLAARG